jgi:1-deoxy-D-xylulose-5-phosphate synthase
MSFLRPLPNMVVMAPRDESQLRHMLRTAVEHPGPAALRYPRGAGVGVPLDAEMVPLPIGRGELLRDGDDVLLVTIGPLAHRALAAAELLAARGIEAAVFDGRFVKPLDAEAVTRLARRCGAVVTAEEHSGIGGFGAAVLEALAAARVCVPVQCLSLPDRIIEHGDAEAVRRACQLDAEGMARAALSLRGGERSLGGGRPAVSSVRLEPPRRSHLPAVSEPVGGRNEPRPVASAFGRRDGTSAAGGPGPVTPIAATIDSEPKR